MTVDNPNGVDEEATSPKHYSGGNRMGLTFTPYFTELRRSSLRSVGMGTPRRGHLQ